MPDVIWRFLHLAAAAYWLGGLIALAGVAVVAARSLERAAFSRLMSRIGRAYLMGSLIAWLLLAISGVALARHNISSLGQLRTTAWGRTLELKTGLAIAAVLLTLAHSWAGGRSSRGAILASRFLSPVILLVTLGIFYLAARLASL